MTFGERLRTILKFRNIQQKDLATNINVTETMVSRWIKGIAIPRIKHLDKISKYLNVSINALLGQEELLERLLESYDKGLFVA